MSKPSRLPLFAFELPNDKAAENLAEEMARKTGQVIVVRDEAGNEVYTAPPRQSRYGSIEKLMNEGPNNGALLLQHPPQ
jgi:hypothetical protein